MDTIMWDVVALVWLAVFAALGAKKGMILALGGLCISILGFVGGFWAVGQLGPTMASILADVLSDSNPLLDTALADVIVFIWIYLVIRIVGGILLHMVNRVCKLPVLRQLNGLGGGAMGFLRGILMLLLLGQVLVLTGLTPDAAELSGSLVAKFFFVGFL